MEHKKNLVSVSIIWVLLVFMSFLWNYANARRERETIAFQTARTIFNLIVVAREWNARHGGVYVPVTATTPPNPALDDPLRDLVGNQRLRLTKLNPAYMTRQLSELALEKEGVQFHLTSLRPLRAQNSPTAREQIILTEFERGAKEKGLFVNEDTKNYFFYMAPLKTEKACLPCHAKQGYQEGDIRGGISVTLPFTTAVPLSALAIGHLGIGLVGLLGIIISGGKLSRAYKTIEKQAVYDALTEIPNRQSFSETIAREFKHNKRGQEPLSIIMCDIDNFKAYNDTYGHGAGDLCLRSVAQAIQHALKRPGDFCARYGGEEFIAILPNTGPTGAMLVAERIRLHVEQLGITHEKSETAQVVTISLGVATTEDTRRLASYEILIQYADRALYQAKNLGRNRVHFFSERT